MKSVLKISISLIFILIFFSACSYSFTGASVDPHLKNIAIPIASDRSGAGEAGLKEDFTSALIEQFTSDNTLKVTSKENADAILECSITSLRETPVNVSNNESVTTNRITIQILVSYKDLIKKVQIFNKNFTVFEDYDLTTSDIFTNRTNAITSVIEKAAEEILLGVVSNW